MSNKQELSQISASDAKKLGVTALAVRPNDASRFGQGGLSAKALQEWFDQLPNFVIKHYNEIVKMLASSDAAKYIGIEALDADNLYDFLQLFGERGTGQNDKNISDYIQTLYTADGESTEKSMPLNYIVANIASRIASANAALSSLKDLLNSVELVSNDNNQITLRFKSDEKVVIEKTAGAPVKTSGIADGAVTFEKLESGLGERLVSLEDSTQKNITSLYDILNSAFISVDPDNLIKFYFDAGEFYVSTSAQIKPVKTAGIADGAVTSDKLSPSVSQTIGDAFIEAEYDPATGSLKFNSLNGEFTINLPLELVVSSGRFDSDTKDIVLVLNNGNEINIPLDKFVERVVSDIGDLKSDINRSFSDASLSPNLQLIFTANGGTQKAVDLSGLKDYGGGLAKPLIVTFDKPDHVTHTPQEIHEHVKNGGRVELWRDGWCYALYYADTNLAQFSYAEPEENALYGVFVREDGSVEEYKHIHVDQDNFDVMLSDIDAALDSIIAIQESILGGA